MVMIHKPPNEKVIENVYVGLSEDSEGKNGIAASYIPGLGSNVMVTANDVVLEFMKGQVPELEEMLDMKIRIYKFTRAEVVFETGRAK